MTATALAGRRLAWPLAVVMAFALGAQAPALGAPQADRQPPNPQDVAGVAVEPVKHTPRPTWTAGDREVRHAPEVTWPAAAAATVDLSAGGSARAGDSPIAVAAVLGVGSDVQRPTAASAQGVGKVAVEVGDRAAAAKAGVSGLVLKVRRADGLARAGTVSVQVDYSSFAGAYGGDWASRLRLVTLPDGKPLPTTNDTAASTLTAVVPLAADGTATALAATAGPSGDNGDYKATSLSPASTWQVSQQTGSFSWSYPLRTPVAVGGPEPSLGLAYSSGALDGRTAGTNNQGSWIGDGWDMWPGYVERQYRSCSADKDEIRGNQPNNKTVNSGDLCWFKPEGNATISLNGRATELVKSAGDTWKGVDDDGSKIELLTNASYNNGDEDGEYWKVTTIDGTQYFFGRNSGQGGASAGTVTNSVWTTPVYANHPDEHSYNASYAASRKQQGWRWNLDYVVDRHGNTMTYLYERETGAYGREGDVSKRTTYDRGGYLTRIEYGSRSDAAASTQPAARVIFDVADRCVTNCYSGTNPVKESWRDTPWDQYCAAAPCTDQLAPTFWTQKRLSSVRSQVYSGTGTTFNEVEWWTLRHTYLQSGDNEGEPMWLAGITRTGKVTTAGGAEVSDPEIVFDPGAEALPNRVDGPADGRSNLFRYRINRITTESGAQITFSYSAPECTLTTLPAVHTNTKRCYPQWYGPDGEEPTLDWFHKYRVTRVDVYDNTGGFAHEQTHYDYLDPPAWRYDDSELVDEKKRTWSQFRGYGRVQVRKGLESGVQSAVEYLYLRGMDGDKQPTGTRDIWVTDSQGTTIEDHEAFAGTLLEEKTLLGPGGAVVGGSINTPVKQGPTASSGPLKAWMTNTGTVRSRTPLSTGGTRWTRTETTFNSDNLAVQVNDLGDEATDDDDVCTTTTYARNPAVWLLDKVKKVETVGVRCNATPVLPGDMLSSVRTTYDLDTNDWDTYLPTKGDVAKIEEISRWIGTTPVWGTTSRAAYDVNGRVTDTYDPLGRKTATTYTPAVAGPVTATTVTNALERSVTSTYATAWDLPVSTVDDENGFRTDLTYDGLGRLLKVWLPGRAKATYPNAPNLEYSYLVRNNASAVITTKTLMPSVSLLYSTSTTLFDGMLRQRQTQTQAPGGGRVLTDTVYDSRGLVEWASNPYYDTTNAPPGTTLVAGPGTPAVPAITENVYDGAERITNAIFKVNGAEKWRTTTSYGGGDTTIVTPPDGGTKTQTVLDARARLRELRQYHSRTATTFDKTTYTYTDRGELATVTNPAGNTWRYFYDQRGRKVREEDPDKGVTESTFDDAGQLTTVKDARDVVLAYTYDDLGRRTSVRDNSTAGNKRAEWIYDTLPNGIGKLTKSIRYEPAGSANAYVNEIAAYDTAGRPTSTKVTIPASEGALCAAGGTTPCVYTYATEYRPDGQTHSFTLPAAGGLASEKLLATYNDVGLPQGMLAAGQIYASNTYNKLGQLTQRKLGADGKHTWITYTIDPHTGRLTNANAIPELKPEVFNFTYTYNDAGNITKIDDQPANGVRDVQCYAYDYATRLTEAWTPASTDCATTRTVAGLGGPAPYWHSYEYDTSNPGAPGLAGSRTKETWHGAVDTTRTYVYPTQGGPAGSQPHTVDRVETTGATTRTDEYDYDDAGNTILRPGGTNGQQLTWDNEGHLDSVTDSTGRTRYLYDADGNRLIRRDPTGATLYLPAGVEIRAPTGSTGSCTRYYTHAGAVIAMRAVTGVSWLAGDHHGTSEVTISNTDLSVSRRRTLPFGDTRGPTTGAWPAAMDKGFVGGTADNTGLTHLGAREYDPKIGRFISVDPVMDLTSPQQMQGYSYANNNPTNLSDPAGLDPGGGQCAEKGMCGMRPPKKDDDKGGGGPSGGGGSIAGADRDIADRHRKAREDFLRIITPDNPICQQGYKSRCEAERRAVEKGVDAHGNPINVYNSWVRVVCGDGWGSTDCMNELGYQWDCPVQCSLSMTDSSALLGAFAGGVEAMGAGVTNTAVRIAAGKAVIAQVGRSGDEVGGLGARLFTAYCSFSADTEVLMADGTTKPISEIKIGDQVLATDPENGERGARTVTALWIHNDTLIDLKIDNGRLSTTEDHPFWNATDRQWQPAKVLDSGDRLLSAEGATIPVDGFIANSARYDTAYNLTVDDLHTYYVLAGTTSILVHNTGPCGKAIVDPGKFDYMFGNVASNSHNAARSAQNQAQFASVGVYNNAEGRGLLQSHFDEVVGSGSNVMRTFKNDHGEFQVRDSLFAGPGGFLHLETTWQVTASGLRLTTVIPRGGR
jgi:RHS repeat-associated protein